MVNLLGVKRKGRFFLAKDFRERFVKQGIESLRVGLGKVKRR